MQPTSSITAIEVVAHVQAGLAECPSDLQQWVRGLLVEPRPLTLKWEYGSNESHLAWVFADLGTRNVLAAYCAGGFGALGSPWGLVFGDSEYFGQDPAWCQSLAELFSEWRGDNDT